MLWLFQFEHSLRNADDHQNLHQQSIAQATVVYYCSRMEAVSLMPCQTYHIHRVQVLSHVPRLGRRVTTASPNICFGTLPVSDAVQCQSGPRAHLIIPENNVEHLAHLSARDVCSFPISPHVRYLRSRPFSPSARTAGVKSSRDRKVLSNRWRPRRGEESRRSSRGGREMAAKSVLLGGAPR